jgi:plastocyanin
MRRLLLLAAAVALVAALPALAAPQKTVLTGTVGPGFSISLKKSGQAVKTLPAGVYAVTVRDNASIHNFHLTGPGVNKSTTEVFTGTKTWIVTLRRGTYRYVCDPHSFQMKGSFKVT